MAEIRLTKGYVAIVDDEDYAVLSRFRWYASVRGPLVYARRTTDKAYLHRVLLPDAKEVDHVDGNGLNNVRANLRNATRTQNLQNSRPRVGTTSRFKGVFRRRNGTYLAYITVDGDRHYLGTHRSEQGAADAYDTAARKAFGEFARTNAS